MVASLAEVARGDARGVARDRRVAADPRVTATRASDLPGGLTPTTTVLRARDGRRSVRRPRATLATIATRRRGIVRCGGRPPASRSPRPATTLSAPRPQPAPPDSLPRSSTTAPTPNPDRWWTSPRPSRREGASRRASRSTPRSTNPPPPRPARRGSPRRPRAPPPPRPPAKSAGKPATRRRRRRDDRRHRRDPRFSRRRRK